MKLSVAIAAENALPSAFVVWRGFEKSIMKASEYGYHGVELALKTADDVNPGKLNRWLEKYNLEVSCISTGQVFAALGLYFTHPDKEVRDKAVKVLNDLILLAGDFGKMVNIGRVRGYIAEGQTYRTAEDLFIETAGKICETADKYGVTVVIEPVNRYEINFVNNLDEGALLVSKLKNKNTGLMPDLFHMNIEDARIGESIKRNAHLIKYIHFADSNRMAPGQGHINYDEVFDALYESGFNGWAAVEILPKPDPDTAAKQAAEFLLPKINEFNCKTEKRNKERGHNIVSG